MLGSGFGGITPVLLRGLGSTLEGGGWVVQLQCLATFLMLGVTARAVCWASCKASR
jgi:hypothetical protein